MSLALTSQGAERYRGGTHCPDHHDGIRTGFPDWCCCCDPCLYIRPSEDGALIDLASHSCRCVPILICCTFTPDEGSINCAKSIQSAAFPQFTQATVPGTIVYDFGFDIQLTILESVWRFYSLSLSIDQSFVIDHVTTTCLKVPDITISGVVIGGVTGTFTFAEYVSSKLPFSSRRLTNLTEQAVATTPAKCSCTTVTPKLCVNGRRHAGGDIEQVEFIWNEALDDRWSYLPPCGDPTLHQEHIYLRGDDDGNCYLEFDFEQSGSETNDWAEPPTSDGDVAKMEPITTCTCEMFIQTQSTDERFVTISGGRCANYSYPCGSCRCVPTYLCVFGEIDGEFIQSRATWYVEDNGNDPIDDYGWRLDDFSDITLKLVSAGCPRNDQDIEQFSDDPVRGCALQAKRTVGGDALTNKSDIIECGPFLRAEMESDYDDDNDRVNWLWVSSSICGNCLVSTCGECPERCGSNPETLYVDLHGIDNGPDDPLDPNFGVQTFCDLTVEVHYFLQWDETTRGTPKCGYIGYSAPITCGDDVYRIRVYMDNFGITGNVSRRYISGPIFDDYGPTGYESGANIYHGPELNYNQPPFTFETDVLVCDPFSKTTTNDWSGFWCMWSCDFSIDQVEVTVYE